MMTAQVPQPTDTQQLSDFKRALDHAAIVATTDVGGQITYVNDKFCEISGYSRDELIGQDHRIINSGYHPTGVHPRPVGSRLANGQCMARRTARSCERRRSMLGRHDHCSLPERKPGPYQYIAIRADITARKAAEDRLAEQAALARIGQMAAVVAHEVRNPLAGIKGAIQILMSRRASADAELPVMRDIIARIDALSELINDLMLFARPRPLSIDEVGLRILVDDAIAAFTCDPIGRGIELTVTGADSVICVDGEMIRAALLNLLLNAAQAMAGHGRIAIALHCRGEQAVVEIRDTGPGIPADIREKVFEPFFTTKARGGGLGLAIARRTAERHNGSLQLSCPSEGGIRLRWRSRHGREAFSTEARRQPPAAKVDGVDASSVRAGLVGLPDDRPEERDVKGFGHPS